MWDISQQNNRNTKGRILQQQQQHITTTSPCGSSRQLRTCDSLLSYLHMHPHTPTFILYILYSHVTHIKMIMNWFISVDFQSFDSDACYITYCFYTTFMLEPFHSPPTNVLFSWMYFQTLHNIYRFSDCPDTTKALCRVSAKTKAKATEDKST